MVETVSLRPLPKMHQAYDSPLGEAIPKTPLRAVDLSQRMTALPTVSSRVYAFSVEAALVRPSLHFDQQGYCPAPATAAQLPGLQMQ
jgi:hypothetical protein